MVTLRDVKKFLDDCENDYGITTGMYGDKLEIYRFDGEPIDDDVLIATVNADFDIEKTDGSVCPFNDGYGFIEDIENASVKDIVYAIFRKIYIEWPRTGETFLIVGVVELYLG